MFKIWIYEVKCWIILNKMEKNTPLKSPIPQFDWLDFGDVCVSNTMHMIFQKCIKFDQFEKNWVGSHL